MTNPASSRPVCGEAGCGCDTAADRASGTGRSGLPIAKTARHRLRGDWRRRRPGQIDSGHGNDEYRGPCRRDRSSRHPAPRFLAFRHQGTPPGPRSRRRTARPESPRPGSGRTRRARRADPSVAGMRAPPTRTGITVRPRFTPIAISWRTRSSPAPARVLRISSQRGPTTASRCVHFASVCSMRRGEVLAGADVLNVHEHAVAAKPRRQPVHEPARVPRAVLSPIS